MDSQWVIKNILMIIYEVLSRKIPQILSRKIFSTKMAWQESRCVFPFLAILLCGFHNGISATSKLDSILQTIDESLTDLDRKADSVSFELSHAPELYSPLDTSLDNLLPQPTLNNLGQATVETQCGKSTYRVSKQVFYPKLVGTSYIMAYGLLF